MPHVDIKCPKCNAQTIEKLKNQEHQCRKCGYIFYFVTPECGTQHTLSRYEL